MTFSLAPHGEAKKGMWRLALGRSGHPPVPDGKRETMTHPLAFPNQHRRPRSILRPAPPSSRIEGGSCDPAGGDESIAISPVVVEDHCDERPLLLPMTPTDRGIARCPFDADIISADTSRAGCDFEKWISRNTQDNPNS